MFARPAEDRGAGRCRPPSPASGANGARGGRRPWRSVETEAKREETRMRYAIVTSGGKQYVAREGQSLEVDRLDSATGQSIEFSEVLLAAGGGGGGGGGAPAPRGRSRARYAARRSSSSATSRRNGVGASWGTARPTPGCSSTALTFPASIGGRMPNRPQSPSPRRRPARRASRSRHRPSPPPPSPPPPNRRGANRRGASRRRASPRRGSPA